jgi:hypothetical protein
MAEHDPLVTQRDIVGDVWNWSTDLGNRSPDLWPTLHTRRCSVVAGTTTSMRPVSTS